MSKDAEVKVDLDCRELKACLEQTVSKSKTTHVYPDDDVFESRACGAYAYADAMMKARQKGQP